MLMTSIKLSFLNVLPTNKRLAIGAERRLGKLLNRRSSRGLPWRKLLVRLATVYTFAISPALLAGSDTGLCGPNGEHVFESAKYYHGDGLIRLDEDRTVQVILETDEEGGEVVLFSAAFFQDAGPFDADLFPGVDTTVPITVSERRASLYHETKLYVDDDREATFTFFVEANECSITKRELEQYLNNRIYPAAALRRNNLPTGTKLDSAEVREALAYPLTVLEPGAATLSVLWCQSGGPGAKSCSIDYGGIGPILAGGCSAYCVAPQYACCGLGLRSNCTCRSPSSGDGDSDERWWLPSWWPWPGGDDVDSLVEDQY